MLASLALVLSMYAMEREEKQQENIEQKVRRKVKAKRSTPRTVQEIMTEFNKQMRENVITEKSVKKHSRDPESQNKNDSDGENGLRKFLADSRKQSFDSDNQTIIDFFFPDNNENLYAENAEKIAFLLALLQSCNHLSTSEKIERIANLISYTPEKTVDSDGEFGRLEEFAIGSLNWYAQQQNESPDLQAHK